MVFNRLFTWLFYPSNEDVSRLIRAFPSALHDDVRTVIEILPFKDRMVRLADCNFHRVDNFVSDYRPQELILQGEKIELPYRVYVNEPEAAGFAGLSELQVKIVSCIYLRHHDGLVRQKHLEKLIGASDHFICPFAVQLLGEYVIEILHVLERVITPDVIEEYAEYIANNPYYWMQTESRMISYWNEYYRREFPNLKDYVGKRLVDKLNQKNRQREDLRYAAIIQKRKSETTISLDDYLASRG